MNKKFIKFLAISLAILMILAVLAPIFLSASAASVDSLQNELDQILKDKKDLENKIANTNKNKITVATKKNQIDDGINILQKEILRDKNYDISRFVSLVSHAFLPTVVYQLEEFGMPRMISKKVHNSKLINFYDRDLNIHTSLDLFSKIGIKRVLAIQGLSPFDKYIIEYFFDGIKINEWKQ